MNKYAPIVNVAYVRSGFRRTVPIATMSSHALSYQRVVESRRGTYVRLSKTMCMPGTLPSGLVRRGADRVKHGLE